MRPLGQFVDWIAHIVTERRGIVLVITAAVVASLGSQIHHIRSNSSIEHLVAQIEGHEKIAAEFERAFGKSEQTVLVLVEARDVRELGVLQFAHRLAARLEDLRTVSSVVSLTTTRLPHRSDRLSAGASGGFSFAGLMAEPDDAVAREKYGIALSDVMPIVLGDTEHFPVGLMSLQAKTQGLRTTPLVEGADVDEEERTDVERFIESSRLVDGRLISRDRTMLAILLSLRPKLHTDRDLADTVQSITDETERAGAPPSGVRVRLSGHPVLRASMLTKLRRDQLTLNPLTLVICIVILAITFRWWPAVVIPVAAVTCTALITVGGMAIFGQPLTILTNVIPPQLIVIGLSDSIHLVGRYRDELVRHTSSALAGQEAMRAMVVACFLTAGTTAVGFGSFALSDTPELQSFGAIAGIGVMVGYLMTILFVPAAITFAKGRASESRKDRIGHSVFAITRVVLRRPWVVLACAAAVFAVSTWLTTQLSADARLLDAFDTRDEVYHATKLIDRKLTGVRPLEIMFSTREENGLLEPTEAAALDRLAVWARKQPGVLDTFHYGDILHEVSVVLTDDSAIASAPFRSVEHTRALAAVSRIKEKGPLPRYLTKDGRVGRMTIGLADIGVRQSITFIERLESELRAHGPAGATFSLTGEGYTGSRGRAEMLESLLWDLLSAIGVVFAMVFLMFRNLRLGLLSVPPSLLPLVVTSAYMALRGITLNLATAITFSIAIGLAVDGTIHLVARYREEATRLRSTTVAMLRAARGTGRANVITCVTLFFGFSAMLLSSFVPVRQFAELITVSVFAMLISTILVQPALFKVAGGAALARGTLEAEGTRSGIATSQNLR